MRSLALLALFMTAFCCPIHGQREYDHRTSGTFIYTWSNEWSVAAGDTLRLRRVLLNPTDTVLTDFPSPCESLSTDVTLVSTAKTCSVPKLELFPGDSIWAEVEGVVAMRGGGVPQRGRRLPAPSPFLRIPIVLQFRSHLSQYPLEEIDIRMVGSRAVHNSGASREEDPGFMPVFMSLPAAQAVAGEIPYLLLTLTISGDRQLGLTTCWIGQDETVLGGHCEEPERLFPVNVPTPFVLGMKVYEEVTRAMAERASIDVGGELDCR